MNKNLTCLVGDVSAAVQNLSDTVATLRSKQHEQSELKELKAEVASLKAILLGRYIVSNLKIYLVRNM